MDKINRESNQCNKLQSNLKRILWATSSDIVKMYEENGVYPTIEYDICKEYDSAVILGNLDELLGKLWVYLNFYHESKEVQINTINEILNTINRYAEMAHCECVKEQASLVPKIYDAEQKVLQTNVDSLNRQIENVNEKSVGKSLLKTVQTNMSKIRNFRILQKRHKDNMQT